MWDLVGKSKDRFSHNVAHLLTFVCFVTGNSQMQSQSDMPLPALTNQSRKSNEKLQSDMPLPALTNQSRKAKKKKCHVSGNPTDPTFLGPTLNFFETF